MSTKAIIFQNIMRLNQLRLILLVICQYSQVSYKDMPENFKLHSDDVNDLHQLEMENTFDSCMGDSSDHMRHIYRPFIYQN